MNPRNPFPALLLLLCLAWPVLGQQKKLDPAAAAKKIDELLAADWKSHQLKPNPPISDEVFLRRIYLDAIGRIPTKLEAAAFLESKDARKRTKLIDTLLNSEGYPRHLFHFYADILRVQTRANGGQGEMTSKPYVEHIKRRVRENQPYDQFVRELVTAQGKVWDNPAIGYYMRDLGMPLDNLSLTTRIFLGTRLECAQCHNHPFDKWTQMQFYQLAAFTFPQETNYAGIAAQIGADDLMRQTHRRLDAVMKKGTDAEKKGAEAEAAEARWIGRIYENLGDFVRYSKVQSVPTRQLRLPRDYQYTDAKPGDFVKPAVIFGEAPEGASGVDAFGEWLTSPENPRFTTVIANRLWKKVFGRGLIEPVDEMFDDTVAVNPALMKHLEQVMKSSGYDVKEFLRVLFLTETYQRETSQVELTLGETYRFTGPVLRRMTAEQMWDSFVTLIHPTPELPRRHGIDQETAAKLAYRGKLSDALDLMSAEEIFKGSMKAAKAYEGISKQSGELKDQFAAAQKAKDKERVEKLSNEIRSLEYTARTSINENVVLPAVARLYTRKTGQPAPPPIPETKPDASMMMRSNTRPYIDIPGYQPDDTIPKEEAAAEEARMEVFQAEAKRYGIPAAEMERFLKIRQGHFREWPRAIDLESPSPRGHALRDFGQSDRDMVENANAEASVPQVLVLMNSRLCEQVLTPYTQLSLSLEGVTTPEEQANAVYLTLLGRYPTKAELAIWDQMRQAGLDKVDDLVFSLINSRQFMFVR